MVGLCDKLGRPSKYRRPLHDPAAQAASFRIIGVMTLTSSEGTLGERFKLELLFNSSLRNLTRIKTGINPTIRGESCIAILDTNAALRLLRGEGRWAVRQYLDCMSGPAQVWSSADGKLAFIISKKTSQLEVVETNFDADGFSGQNGARFSTSKPRTRSVSRPSRKPQRMGGNYGFRKSWRIPYRRGRSTLSRGSSIRCRSTRRRQSC